MKRMLSIAVLALLPLGFSAFVRAEGGGQAKNLQILPKTIPIRELKERMKAMSKSLGVQCDHCHDTDDFAKDSEVKKVARSMLQLTADLNKRYFQAKDMVSCGTCHNNQRFPPMGGADLDKLKAKASK